MSEPITALYAWIITEEGEESVPAVRLGREWFPLYASSLPLARRMRAAAEAIAREKGLPLRLVRFTAREGLEEVKG